MSIFADPCVESLLSLINPFFSDYRAAITNLKDSCDFLHSDELFDLVGLTNLQYVVSAAISLFNKIEAYIKLNMDKAKALLLIYEVVIEMSPEHAAVFVRPEFAKNIERLANVHKAKLGRIKSGDLMSPHSRSYRGSQEDKYISNGSGNSGSDKMLNKLGNYRP